MFHDRARYRCGYKWYNLCRSTRCFFCWALGKTVFHHLWKKLFLLFFPKRKIEIFFNCSPKTMRLITRKKDRAKWDLKNLWVKRFKVNNGKLWLCKRHKSRFAIKVYTNKEAKSCMHSQRWRKLLWRSFRVSFSCIIKNSIFRQHFRVYE